MTQFPTMMMMVIIISGRVYCWIKIGEKRWKKRQLSREQEGKIRSPIHTSRHCKKKNFHAKLVLTSTNHDATMLPHAAAHFFPSFLWQEDGVGLFIWFRCPSFHFSEKDINAHRYPETISYTEDTVT